MSEAQPLEKAFADIGATTASRHLFLCIGPHCCESEAGLALWQHLKQRAKALPVLRSKADCLRICQGGPWLVIYPEGAWYGNVTPERCDRILREHVEDGRPITEWLAFPPCMKISDSNAT